MFNKKTVFILGAGASVPYGYPIGSKLIHEIIECGNDEIYIPIIDKKLGNKPKYYWNEHDKEYDLSDFISNFNQFHTYESISNITFKPSQSSHPFPNTFEYCKKNFYKVKLKKLKQFNELKNVLIEFNPVSIDNFLQLNPSYADFGKIMIMCTLLKHEDISLFGMNEDATNDNWYTFLLNDILAGCSDKPDIINENNLNFITFNYDKSLSAYLHRKLYDTGIYQKNPGIIDSFLEKCKPLHMHGQLYDHKEIDRYGKFIGNTSENATKRFYLSMAEKDNISLIRDKNSDIQKNVHAQSKKILTEAQEIIIIGFGFDRENLNLLGFPNSQDGFFDFINGKSLKVFNYDGKMRSIKEQCHKLQKRGDSSISISDSSKISDAYSNDFKIRLFS